MIENGGTTIGNAGQIVDVNGDASSMSMEDREEAVDDGRADDQGPWADPVGCTNFLKSSENQHLGDALCPKCSPIMSPMTVLEDRQSRASARLALRDHR